jgi:hypothetical protein
VEIIDNTKNHSITIITTTIIMIISEWWGSPLAQEEKYQGRKKTCDKK